MAHKPILWMVFGGVIALSFYPILVEAQDYFGKFPPTPAWQTVEVANDAIMNPFVVGNTIINATSYADKIFIVTDGSILINITEYP